LETDSDEKISSDSESELHEDTVAAGNVNGSQDNTLSKPQHPLNSGGVHPFIGTPSGLKIWRTPCEQGFDTDYRLFLFFIDVIQLLMAETDKNYNQYLGTLDNDNRFSRLPDVTIQEIMYFWPLPYKTH
jgi:hypothetical protein